MTAPNYTVAICNYNMSDTLEESLRSILEQLDDRFEVLVVDDGSKDGSQEILDNLEKEYNILTWIEGENENIGEARAQANREAKGDYILTQLDVDDRYEPVIEDFVKIFEIINEEIERDFYLSANGLNMAAKSLLIDINYRGLGYGEDKDLWRRLLAEDALIPLKINQPYTTIGYEYSKVDRFRISYEITKVNFKSGVSFSSFISYKLRNLNYVDDYFKVAISPLAFLKANLESRYNQPEGYEKMGRLYRELEEREATLSEIEKKYDIEIEDELSDKGREILYL